MGNKPIPMGAFLTILWVLLVLIQPIAAQEEQVTEAFDAAELPGWELSPDTTVVNGVLRIYPGNYALRMGNWANLTFSVRLHYAGNVRIRYCFREENHYTIHLIENTLILEKSQNGAVVELGRTAHEGIQINEWLPLRVIAREQSHEIYLQDVLLLSVVDSEPLLSGALLFESPPEGGINEFDDLIMQFNDVPPSEEVAPTPETTVAAPVEEENGVDQLIDEFFAGQADKTELTTFAINMGLAVITSFILSRVYIYWGSSLSNRRKFAANFMLITLTTTFIILVVRSSVALSLGLVGALSIVRFRAAIKDPEELAYLFLAVGLGIGLGDNQRLITILTLIIVVVVLGLTRPFRRPQADANLHLTISSQVPGVVDLGDVLTVLNPYCSRLQLLRLDDTVDTIEIALLVEFKKTADLLRAKAALRGLSERINITFLDNRGMD